MLSVCILSNSVTLVDSFPEDLIRSWTFFSWDLNQSWARSIASNPLDNTCRSCSITWILRSWFIWIKERLVFRISWRKQHSQDTMLWSMPLCSVCLRFSLRLVAELVKLLAALFFSESIWASCHCCNAVRTSALAIALSVTDAMGNCGFSPTTASFKLLGRMVISERVLIIKAPFVMTLFWGEAFWVARGGFGGPNIATWCSQTESRLVSGITTTPRRQTLTCGSVGVLLSICMFP